MAIPVGPTNGQIFTENASGRRYKYNAADGSWRPFDRVAIRDLDDVSDTVLGTANQLLVYNGTTSQWEPSANPTAGAFVPRVESTSDPTNANAYEVGTVWCNTSTGKAWIARTFAPTTGVRYFDEQVATNPGGANLMNGGGEPWGQTFLCPFDCTINIVGLRYDSAVGSATTNVTVNIYQGADGISGGATLLHTTNATGVTSPLTGGWLSVPLTSEVEFVANQTYSMTFETPGITTDRPSHNVNPLGNPFATGASTIVNTALVPNGWDLVYRYGYNEGTIGTIWWPIQTPTGIGLSTIWRNATPPASPVDGRLWYNTTLSALFVYDSTNTNWIQVLQ
jgi:hypothetical protein